MRIDFFTTLAVLFKQTRISASLSTMDSSGDDDTSVVGLLQALVAPLVKMMAKQLKDSSLKIRQAAIGLLRDLINVHDGVLGEHVGALVPGLCFCLSDKSSSTNIVIDTLLLLQRLVQTTSPLTLQPHLLVLYKPVVACINESFYKIVSEALAVTISLARTIRPDVTQPLVPEFAAMVRDLYAACLARLEAMDIDQEVKDRSIICMGGMLATFGDLLVDCLPQCLPIFLARLQNDITSVTTTKALGMVASSPLHVDLTPILVDTLTQLGNFLRRKDRSMKMSSLHTLHILINTFRAATTPAQMSAILAELPALVDAADLHTSQLTLSLAQLIVEVHPALLPSLHDIGFVSRALTLAQSNLLQGSTLQALLSLFRVLASSGAPGFTFDDLLSLVMVPVNEAVGTGVALSRQALATLSKIVAVLAQTNPAQTPSLVASFLGNVQSNAAEPLVLLSLLAVGEIGKVTDLSGHADLLPTVLSVFASPSEDVKTAAAYCLGNVAVGNLPVYIPVLVQQLSEQPTRQYVLLHALKELISTQSASAGSVQALAPFVEQIWGLLFAHCDTKEEGIRNVVAECLGKLTLVNPGQLIPQLEKNLAAVSPYSRATSVTAFKFTTSSHNTAIDSVLKPLAPKIFERLRDDSPDVRRVTLATFNSTAHNKPHLVRDLLAQLLPVLYSETNVRQELIKEVRMGPFVHKVDEGLDARKSAFECLYTLLDTCQDLIDVQPFLACVINGLKDESYDIKMLTFLILVRLSRDSAEDLFMCMDQLAEALAAIVTSKPPKQAVKQEIEKVDELRRSALRAVNAINNLENSGS